MISEVTVASLQTHIREMRDQIDFFIIDLPGQRDPLLATALGLSDHVLIPVQGCAMDAKGAAQVIELLAHMKTQAKISIPHSVVLTRVSSIATTRALTAIKDLLVSRGVNVLETPIFERSAFRDIFDLGTMLHKADPARITNLDKARENARCWRWNSSVCCRPSVANSRWVLLRGFVRGQPDLFRSSIHTKFERRNRMRFRRSSLWISR